MTVNETLEEAIRIWAMRQPKWLQYAIVSLYRSRTIESSSIAAFADIAVSQAAGEDVSSPDEPLSSSASASEPHDIAGILAITELDSINAINWSDGLSFEPRGLTVVYGENGSGKSGYARILKAITRSRHETPVLSNIFEQHREPAAKVRVAHGDELVDLNWPDDRPQFLNRVSFYDSDCGQQYVSTEATIAYRPPAIRLLNALADVAGNVRAELERRRDEIAAERIQLPPVVENTQCALFLSSLSAETTMEDLQEAIGDSAELQQKLKEVNRVLDLVSPEKRDQERQRTTRTLEALRLLVGRMRWAHDSLSSARLLSLLDARAAVVSAQNASHAARAAAFEDEAVDGIGSDSWKVLWAAARQFSDEYAYPEGVFPVTADVDGPALCVLCNQPLEPPAAERLKRFDEFVAAETERTVETLTTRREELIGNTQSHDLKSVDIELSLERLEEWDAEIAEGMRDELESLAKRQALVADPAGPHASSPDILPESQVLTRAEALAQQLDQVLQQSGSRDANQHLVELEQAKSEISSRIQLDEGRGVILQRVEQLRRLRTLQQAIRYTDTNAITRQATRMTREVVGESMRRRFREELEILGLDRITLADVGGQRGSLKLKPTLTQSAQEARLVSVLSEGERSALGLAGFLTEVMSDESLSAVIFDDPVTSLDHVRQERVARRVVELSLTRQVLVFTHDIGFVVDLKRAANVSEADVHERWVWKNSVYLGRVSKGGPWDGKVTPQRKDELNQRIAQIRRTVDTVDPETLAHELRSWYQDLRLAWERAIEDVVVGRVMARGKLEFRPLGLKAIAKFTEEDDRVFEAAFVRCGDRGSHDRSPVLGRTAATFEEMEEDLQTLDTWYERVRKY